MAAFGLPTMLTQEQAVEIEVLARRGVAVREIARQLGLFAQHGEAILEGDAGIALRTAASAADEDRSVQGLY